MIYPSTHRFSSDAYGVNTDNPPSAYELIDGGLKVKDEEVIRESMRDWARGLANDYFNTETWGEYEWDAWMDKVRELF